MFSDPEVALTGATFSAVLETRPVAKTKGLTSGTEEAVSSENRMLKEVFAVGTYDFRLLIINVLRTRKEAGRKGYDTTAYLVIRHYHRLDEYEQKIVRNQLMKHHPGLHRRLSDLAWKWSVPLKRKTDH